MVNKEKKNYKLEGLKKVRNLLAEKDIVAAYGEGCDPDPYGFKRRCTWNYSTIDYNMDDYPCPWDTRILYKNKYKGNSYNRGGCFHRCLLNNSKIKQEHIVEDKVAYIEAIDNLISIMETDSNWKETLNTKSLLSKQGRSIINKSKSRRTQINKICHGNKRLIEEYEKATSKEAISELATKLVEYVKKANIDVLRYDSKNSRSVYLKFDYGMAGSLRLSDHKSEKELHYTFNILSCISGPYKETINSSNGGTFDTYFYPFNMAGNAAMDVVRFKQFRKNKYGEYNYNTLKEKYKQAVGTKKGFWQKSVDV